MRKYNLYEITEILRSAAINHPFVNTVLFDKYKLNSTDDICYPVITFIKNSISISSYIHTATYSIIYVDRLTHERDNEINIQSVGTQIIPEIMNAIYNNFDIDKDGNNITLNYFTDSYADNVAGVVSNNIIFKYQSDLSDCYEYCFDNCLIK